MAIIIIDFQLRQYPPITQLSPIGNSQNGEFETAHCRPPITEIKHIANRQNGKFAAPPRHQARMLVSGRN